MDPQTIGIAITVLMVAMLLLRIPIAVSLVSTAYLGLTLVLLTRGGGFDAVFHSVNSFLGEMAYSSTAEYTFTTIPMFLLMGYVATEAGFTRDIYSAARLWLSRVPGGLAVASSVGCAMFAAISGSSLATAAAMGRMAVPEMLDRKYDKGLATGVVAASGTLGSLIPPSILMILYGVFTEQSIAKLFVAGILPGLLSVAMFTGMIMVRCRRNPQLAPPVPKADFAEKLHSLKRTWGMVGLIVLVVAGLYSGMFTPTEAGGVGSFGAFLLAFMTRRLGKDGASRALKDTLKGTSMLFAAIIGAYMITTFTALTGIAGNLTSWATGLENVPPLVILASMSLLYIFLGTFMGGVEIMLLTLPVVVPIIKGLDYDLIWFGVIMIKYLEIGMVTPPIGINVFVINSVTGNRVRLSQIFRGVTWFIVMDIITLTLLILFPEIALYLPSLM